MFAYQLVFIMPHRLSQALPHQLPLGPTPKTALTVQLMASRALQPCIPPTNDISLLCEYNAKHLGLTDDDLHNAALSEVFYTSYLSLAHPGIDIGTPLSTSAVPHLTTWPTPHSLLSRGFGTPSLAHSFHQEPTFETA